MAYYIKGKTYTDQPLMDEIVYNCKLILEGIVIKNDVLANNCETLNSVDNAEMFFIKKEKKYIPFELFNFTKKILMEYGYSEIDTKFYLQNKYAIPEADRPSLTEFANNYFDENFEEENDYYRMLTGLPPYNTGEEYYIWLTSYDIPYDYTVPVDFSLPLHEQPKELVNVLYAKDTIKRLRNTYPGFNYSYMMYLGDKKLDLYTIRKAAKWDILYIPNVYYLIRDKFIDFYKINREIYMTKSYQEFFSQTGEYYDQMMILILLAQTFSDLVTDTPQWYIRRDIFDLRSCKYFLESSGIEYFKEIPLRYQIRIVKNLNTLIKYKSSNKNINDIIDIFNIKNTYVNKYWLFKKETKNNEFDLEFIASKHTDSYDNYIKNSSFRTPYNDITLQDKYWDGQDTHEFIENNIKNQDFTIRGTKYMSVEYNISLEKYNYELEYMLGMILDSKMYDKLDDLQIAIPSINETANFRISNLFLFLSLLTLEYDEISKDITYPEDMSDGTLPKFTEDEILYDWKVRVMPEAFQKKNGMVFGFNFDANIDHIIKNIKNWRHSHFRFGLSDEEFGTTLTQEEYAEKAEEWIKYFKLREYIIPSDISNIDELVNVYNKNTEIHDIIKDTIVNAPDNNDKVIAEYLYRELFTKKFDIDMYTNKDGYIYDNLEQLMAVRDYILYNEYLVVKNETNIESRREMLRGIMNDIIDTLEYYISDEDGFEYLYSFVSIASPQSVIKYIYLMLDFFKSYKVYFLDPYYTLLADDKLDNNAKAIDNVADWHWTKYTWDKSFAEDNIASMNIQKFGSDNYNITETVDIYAHYDPDPLFDFDIDGFKADILEREDIDGAYADESSSYPYITINGGYSYQGAIDFSEINGGSADVAYKSYYDIDGGVAYDPYADKTDAMGSQMFNYELDGGSANGKVFISNSVIINVLGREILANIRISSKADNIEIDEDGIYIPIDSFPNNERFENLKFNLNSIIERVESEGSTLLDDIRVIKDINLINERIDTNINKVTKNMELAIEANTNDKFYKDNKEFVDTMISYLLSEFKTEESVNPYLWTDL